MPKLAQLSTILNGKIRGLPDWDVVRKIVEASYDHARRHGKKLSAPADLRIWQNRFNAIEAALEYERRPRLDHSKATSDARLAALNGLPRDVVDFTGRDSEIKYILEAITKKLKGGGAALEIHAVDGMAGVGKTALAVHVAHVLSSQFSDVMFIDLLAHTDRQAPYDSGEALQILLTMLGLDGGQIPEHMDTRVALWRTEMARRRVLLVLDNAASADQIRPLLPGSPGSAVIITSRIRLMDLEGVSPLAIDPLPEKAAVRLFAEISGSDRSLNEDAMVRVVQRCGRLPLAIRLSAAWLRHHPVRGVTELEQSLDSTLEPVASAFALSCRDITDEERLMFRRLGLHPGTTFTVEAAAAIGSNNEARSRQMLESLYSRHLIEEPLKGRYRFHDLIRHFAEELAEREDPPRERQKALNRLFGFYADSFRQHGEEAPNWIDAEYENLMACAQAAIQMGSTPFGWMLPKILAVTLQLRGAHIQSESMNTRALQLATIHHDRLGQAGAHVELGVLARHRGDLEGARIHTRVARGIYAQLDRRLELANCDTDLATLDRDARDFVSARFLFAQASSLYSEIGSPIGEANAHAALGELERLAGRYEEARACTERALRLYEGVSNRLGQANVHSNIAAIDLLSGNQDNAEQHLGIALRLHRETNNHAGEAAVNCQLAEINLIRGDLTAARSRWEAALSVYAESGDPEAGVVRSKLRKLVEVDARAEPAEVNELG